MTFNLSCGGQTVTAEVIRDSFSKTEVYWNKLKQADNSARFNAVFTVELSNFLKTFINDDILVTITEGDTPYFYGYVRKSVTFNKTQINQPISIEVVSPSYLLGKTIQRKKAFIATTLENIIDELLDDAGVDFGMRELAELGSTNIEFLSVNDDTTYKEVITQMLYEYGFCWDFNESGFFVVYTLYEDVPETSQIVNEFNGSNCLDQIAIKAREHSHDGVKAVYSRIEEKNGIVFSDSTIEEGVKTENKCYHPIAPGEYFKGEKYNYLDTDSSFGEVRFLLSVLGDIRVSSNDIEYEYSNYDINPDSPTFRDNLINQICFTAHNKSTRNSAYIGNLDFSGPAYVATAEEEVSSFGSDNPEEVTLQYVGDKEQAKYFARKLTDWYRYSNSEISLNSKTDYPLGSFVKVSDYGIGTYYGRITKKVYNLTNGKIQYLIETIGEFVPATVTDKSRPVAGNISYDSLDSILNQANEHTDDAIASAQMQASPIYSAVFNATVIKKGNDGAYSPSEVTARGRALTGDSSETAYNGIWNIYVNNQTTACITLENTELSLSVDQLMTAAGVDELTSVRVDFLAANGNTLIDSQIIPILTGAAAYTVILDNPFQTYEGDESGVIGERTVTTKARVYYGLQEMEYLAEDGWEYGAIVAPAGFDVSVDVLTGVITIKALEGSSMAESGRIEIPIFLHSQTNTEYVIGYVGEARATVEYYFGYGTKYVGYLTPDENGYYYTYFNYQKLTQTAVKLSQLNSKVEGYWLELTDDKNITIAEKETLRILLNSVKAEYESYTAKYSRHTKYGAYKSAYDVLNEAVSAILAYDGVYSFPSETKKNEFNQKFSDYYTAKGNLDAEIASVSTNYGGLSTVNDINKKTPKPTDYFAWVGDDNTVYSATLTLRTGLVYCWDGSAWVEDLDNGHLVASMPSIMDRIKNSDDDTIPAITYAKQMGAMRAFFDSVFSNELTINNVLKSGNFDGTIGEDGKIEEAGSNGFLMTSLGEFIANSGWFRGGLGDTLDVTEMISDSARYLPYQINDTENGLDFNILWAEKFIGGYKYSEIIAIYFTGYNKKLTCEGGGVHPLMPPGDYQDPSAIILYLSDQMLFKDIYFSYGTSHFLYTFIKHRFIYAPGSKYQGWTIYNTRIFMDKK